MNKGRRKAEGRLKHKRRSSTACASIRNPKSQIRNAFTLLEVILALAILAVSLAIVGQVTRLGYRNAERAEMEGEALMIAESVMSQLVAGLTDPVEIATTPWVAGDEEPEWEYSLNIEPTDLPELLQANVRVEQVTELPNPIVVQLSRWVVDPNSIEEVPVTSEEL